MTRSVIECIEWAEGFFLDVYAFWSSSTDKTLTIEVSVQRAGVTGHVFAEEPVAYLGRDEAVALISALQWALAQAEADNCDQ